mmetsp:Transcript_27735/g.111079  ORF Transcript_27735/g.111079 Transcript_27735/m.111079 type:complete len:308 (-) Transcript_27735:670-1593(-)
MLWLDAWIQMLARGERIKSECEVQTLCTHVRSVLIEEANAVRVSSPAIVCGDIHGQFHDLLELFCVLGGLPNSQESASYEETRSFIFLGDYVDRGRNSVEVFELLMCLKAKFPSRIALLRGNHESGLVTQVYGFYDECVWKYGSSTVWRACCDVFECLNVAALVDDRVVCIHGGLSPVLRTLDQMAVLNRVSEVPTWGPLCDLLWSDPAEDNADTDWTVSSRGSGHIFGPHVVTRFLHDNALALLCRAHQLVMEGYKFHFDAKNCWTVWSAPNYCGRCGNVAAVLQIPSRADDTCRFITFDTRLETE